VSVDVVFLDTETLGIQRGAPIWEFAAIRRDQQGQETAYHCFVKHRPWPWLGMLAMEFKMDYLRRYQRADRVHTRAEAAEVVREATAGAAQVVGAVPNFDTERIERQLLLRQGLEPGWHYHLACVENLAVGYLRALRNDHHALNSRGD
jgi:hypothetical protein